MAHVHNVHIVTTLHPMLVGSCGDTINTLHSGAKTAFHSTKNTDFFRSSDQMFFLFIRSHMKRMAINRHALAMVLRHTCSYVCALRPSNLVDLTIADCPNQCFDWMQALNRSLLFSIRFSNNSLSAAVCAQLASNQRPLLARVNCPPVPWQSIPFDRNFHFRLIDVRHARCQEKCVLCGKNGRYAFESWAATPLNG